MARLYKPFRARHSELMSQSLSSFLRQDVPASAIRVPVALQRFSPADSGAVAQALPPLLDRAGLASSFSLCSAHVLVKPNLLTATPLACTSPVVVDAAFCLCRLVIAKSQFPFVAGSVNLINFNTHEHPPIPRRILQSGRSTKRAVRSRSTVP